MRTTEVCMDIVNPNAMTEGVKEFARIAGSWAALPGSRELVKRMENCRAAAQIEMDDACAPGGSRDASVAAMARRDAFAECIDLIKLAGEQYAEHMARQVVPEDA